MANIRQSSSSKKEKKKVPGKKSNKTRPGQLPLVDAKNLASTGGARREMRPGDVGATAPSWWKEYHDRKDTPWNQYVANIVQNRLIPYMDQSTQASTAQYLARANPAGYGKYADVQQPGQMGPGVSNQDAGLPNGQPSPQVMSASMLDFITQGLDWKNLKSSLPTSVQSYMSTGPDNEKKKDDARNLKADVSAGTRWLSEALQTARGALPGSTRAQQAQSQAHLNTLYKEAEQEPERGGLYTTMFENLMNPVMKKNPLSGVFGQSRALGLQSGEYKRRGVAYRNPNLT